MTKKNVWAFISLQLVVGGTAAERVTALAPPQTGSHIDIRIEDEFVRALAAIGHNAADVDVTLQELEACHIETIDDFTRQNIPGAADGHLLGDILENADLPQIAAIANIERKIATAELAGEYGLIVLVTVKVQQHKSGTVEAKFHRERIDADFEIGVKSTAQHSGGIKEIGDRGAKELIAANLAVGVRKGIAQAKLHISGDVTVDTCRSNPDIGFDPSSYACFDLETGGDISKLVKSTRKEAVEKGRGI